MAFPGDLKVAKSRKDGFCRAQAWSCLGSLSLDLWWKIMISMSPVPNICVKPSFQILTPPSLRLPHSTHRRAMETAYSSKGQCKDVIVVEETEDWDQDVSPVSSNGCHGSLKLRQDDQSSPGPTFATNEHKKSPQLDTLTKGREGARLAYTRIRVAVKKYLEQGGRSVSAWEVQYEICPAALAMWWAERSNLSLQSASWEGQDPKWSWRRAVRHPSCITQLCWTL